MGDGRYYTWIQFSKILYYTILSGVLVFGIVYLNTKSRKRRTLRYLLAIKILVLFLTFFRFYEELVFSLDAARIFRQIQMYIALIVFTHIIQLFYNYGKKVVWALVCTWHLAIILPMILLSPGTLITSYTFGKAGYHVFYIYIVGIMTVMIIVGGIKSMFFDSYVTKYDLIQKRFIGLALMIPTLFYSLYIVGIMPKDIPIFYGLLIVSSVLLIVIFIRYTPGELLPLTYIQLVEDIRETVILFDSKQQVIYHNKSDFSKQLNLDDLVCETCYDQLFDGFDIILREELATDIKFELKKDLNHYFIRCKQMMIKKDQEVIGYLLVIEDMTHLESMLTALNSGTKELNTLNETLKEHATVVATIEAERERNKLMLEVQNHLGHRFAEMTKVIESIIGSTESDSDDEVLRQIIMATEVARHNLKDIRKTVIDYRGSYKQNKAKDERYD